MEILVEENPRMYGYNPRRKHRNPSKSRASALSVKNVSQGVGTKEIVGALAGLWLTATLPNVFFKDTSNKFMKVAVAYGGALAAGYIVKMVGGSEAGKAAVIAGLATATAQTLAAYTPIKIGGQLALSPGHVSASVVAPVNVPSQQFFSVT